MSALTVLVVGVLGGVGAIGRFALDGAISRRAGRSFPFGTLGVNVLGSLAAGALVGAALDADAFRALGTGLIGAFTTFSTWALESHRLGEDGRPELGIANFAVSLALGVVAAWAGRELGALW